MTVPSPEVKAEVEKSQALAKKMGVNGTPHFLIGDRAIAGAPDAGLLLLLSFMQCNTNLARMRQRPLGERERG